MSALSSKGSNKMREEKRTKAQNFEKNARMPDLAIHLNQLDDFTLKNSALC